MVFAASGLSEVEWQRVRGLQCDTGLSCQVSPLVPLSSGTKLSLNLPTLHLGHQKSAVPLLSIQGGTGTEWVFNNHFIMINIREIFFYGVF